MYTKVPIKIFPLNNVQICVICEENMLPNLAPLFLDYKKFTKVEMKNHIATLHRRILGNQGHGVWFDIPLLNSLQIVKKFHNGIPQYHGKHGLLHEFQPKPSNRHGEEACQSIHLNLIPNLHNLLIQNILHLLIYCNHQ